MAAVQETDADMAGSLFCVCAPGATQDTTRLFKAILKGCIPVTFFRCPPSHSLHASLNCGPYA